MYTVYADILFFVNFTMDFLCFYLLCTLFSRKMRILPVTMAAAIGALYGVVSVLISVDGLLLLLLDLLVCALMCRIALVGGGRPTLRRVATDTLVYMGISMMLGGVMTAVYRCWNEMGIAALLPEDTESGLSPWVFFLLAAIGGGATLLGGRFRLNCAVAAYYDVRVRLCGREAVFRAVVDTGNGVEDPISGMRAVMLDRKAAERLLPREILSEAEADFSAMGEDYRRRARLLPVRTVTGSGMLLAFRCDGCRVSAVGETGGEERSLLVAITDLHSGDAEALLPPLRHAAGNERRETT